MCDSPTLYVDDTFKYCTKFFHQLFSIHAYRNGVFVPVVFCLLPNKNKDTYTAILYLFYFILPMTTIFVANCLYYYYYYYYYYTMFRLGCLSRFQYYLFI